MNEGLSLHLESLCDVAMKVGGFSYLLGIVSYFQSSFKRRHLN